MFIIYLITAVSDILLVLLLKQIPGLGEFVRFSKWWSMFAWNLFCSVQFYLNKIENWSYVKYSESLSIFSRKFPTRVGKSLKYICLKNNIEYSNFHLWIKYIYKCYFIVFFFHRNVLLPFSFERESCACRIQWDLKELGLMAPAVVFRYFVNRIRQ